MDRPWRKGVKNKRSCGDTDGSRVLSHDGKGAEAVSPSDQIRPQARKSDQERFPTLKLLAGSDELDVRGGHGMRMLIESAARGEVFGATEATTRPYSRRVLGGRPARMTSLSDRSAGPGIRQSFQEPFAGGGGQVRDESPGTIDLDLAGVFPDESSIEGPMLGDAARFSDMGGGLHPYDPGIGLWSRSSGSTSVPSPPEYEGGIGLCVTGTAKPTTAARTGVAGLAVMARPGGSDQTSSVGEEAAVSSKVEAIPLPEQEQYKREQASVAQSVLDWITTTGVPSQRDSGDTDGSRFLSYDGEEAEAVSPTKSVPKPGNQTRSASQR